MDFKSYLLSWAEEVDEFLLDYLKSRAIEAKKVTPIAASLITDFSNFIVGGKRVRAGLVKLGYEIFGGKDFKQLLPIAAAVEILHGAFLVHDDIIDQDLIRHGKPTFHALYSPPLHYGESIAIVAGDIGFFETFKIILDANLPHEIKEKITKEVITVSLETGFGEALDVEMSTKSEIHEEDILKVHRLKTASYTFVGPLTFGGLAAGVRTKDLVNIKDFALPLGLAFQLQDDILGMFGDERILGKSASSDIKEGKKTLLYLKALERADRKDHDFLKKLWGNPRTNKEELEEARRIVRETGSLDYSVNTARKLVKEAKSAIRRLTEDTKLQEILRTLADYIVEREK